MLINEWLFILNHIIMLVGIAIQSILINKQELTNIVGTNIFPVMIPQSIESPAIRYYVHGTSPSDTKDGISELDTYMIYVDCFSTSYYQVSVMALQVRNAMDRKFGTFEGVDIDNIFFVDCIDDYEESTNERGEYIKHVIFKVRVSNPHIMPNP